MLNIAICDDSNCFLETLLPLLQKKMVQAGYIADIFSTTKPSALLNELQSRSMEPGRQFHIVLLDLEMPDMHGFEVTSRIKSIDNSCYIIYVTAHDEEVYNSFHYGVNGFVAKQYVDLQLPHEIDVAIQHMRESRASHVVSLPILLDNGEGKRRQLVDMVFEVDGISYIESVSRELFVHYSGKRFPVRYKNFGVLVSIFEPYDFVQIFRSIAVNPSNVSSVGINTVILDNGTELPMNRKSKEILLSKFSSI